MQRLTFELIQHTPIIHFQANDKGATLRASEVKPKLDKYLMRKFEKKRTKSKKENKLIPLQKWCIPNQEQALDYKLSFLLDAGASNKIFLPISSTIRKEILPIEAELLSESPYFANEEYIKEGDEQWSEVRYAIQCSKKIQGVIYSKHKDLCTEIEKHLEEFFLRHNFGARQTKGFGSFTLFSVNGEKKTRDFDIYFREKEAYKLNVSTKELEEVFREIQRKHSQIKTKSLRRFFNSKTEFDLFKDMQGGKEFNENDFLFVRPLLGLANKYDFSDDQRYETIKVNHNPPEDAFTIERFGSPLLYKPIQTSIGKYEIYVLLKGIPRQIKGTSFQLLASEETSPTIKTPSELELRTFIEEKCNSFLKKI